ncbi:uncharacterized protein [Sinocyclocheilus grahami]|uniref:uncharacterized protein n=1 Tax=Sinocyclocheilus grahami TaxID=75366 RepID=UPI0007AD07EF|nr:PREDICTED: uncharacterized protein LOC107574840 [Sinocyclocheilus grahami]
MKTEEVKTAVGQSVTLHSGVEEYHQISWMFENRNIAKCRGNTDGTPSCEITDERLRGRLKIDSQNGSLTIINISSELTGLYKLQIIDSSSKKSSHKQFNVTVSEADLHQDNEALINVLVIAAAVGAAASGAAAAAGGAAGAAAAAVGSAALIYCCYKKFRPARQNGKERLRLSMSPWFPEKGNETLRPLAMLQAFLCTSPSDKKLMTRATVKF